VNDGSKDGTLDILMREFDLWESISPSANVKTAEILDVYASPSDRLVVVDKTSGGKADALNAGICAALPPLVSAADIILEEDTSPQSHGHGPGNRAVVAVGGIIRVANGCEVDSDASSESRP